ncbi:MAG: asparagine synthase (glutamine-hydrolyzing) [Flavisolibacter sp.]
MCGILGVLGKIDGPSFQKCLDTIIHRGPDGEGTWSDGVITLGHRRLSIIDLSENGKQPMEILDRYVIVYNGEIYNYIEIRTSLEKKGVVFFSNSDTEVLLYSYHTWGKDCVQRFNGMWAFAIWDKQERTIFLSRDRMGKKPLFYVFKNDRFAFASEMKALYPLLSHMEINSELVEQAKNDVFCYETTRDCLIKNIFRFPAATNGIFKQGDLSFYKYWEPLETLIDVPSKYEQQVEQFRELFIDACHIRMRSDVPVGTALSGGLDSSATISTMAHIAHTNTSHDYSRDWQHAFVASFPGSAIDESPFAKRVVDHINIPATYLTIDPLKNIERLDYYTYMFEELYLTSPIPFIQLYGEVKKHGTTVTLDGHGSDELFGGYPFDIYEKIKDDFPNIREMKKTLETYLDGIKEPYNKSMMWRHVFHHFRKQLGRSKEKRDISGFLNNRLFQSTFKTILPTLLRNYDRYSMINGVEIRMPFLDHRIISFAFSLPASAKVRNGFTKAIVRDAVKDLMPFDIAFRKDKIGFNSPFSDWIRGPLRIWVKDIINSKEFEESQLISPVMVKEKIYKVLNGPISDFKSGENAWISLMPYFWEKSLTHARKLSTDSFVCL